jgi:pre-mRNA-splicing factor 38B
MSRSALWRQEGNVKERERRADDLFLGAVEQGRQRQRSKGILPLWGPEDSFHLNPLLLQNLVQSPYFQKCCQELNDWNAVVDDIYYQVQHLQPFQTAGTKTPSSAFCLLLRMLTLRMTEHQMKLTLDHVDSPFIRGIGFLYLRFAGPIDELWKWIEPYVYDQEDIQVTVGHGSRPQTVGDFVRHLFSSREYFGTPLPRLPLPIERDLKVKLLAADKVAARAKQNYEQHMQYFSGLGNRVMALYGDEDNPITWYEGVVDRVLTRDEATGHDLKHPKYVVTFPEYGNTETVLLGEMDILQGTWKLDTLGAANANGSRSSSGRSGGDSGRPDLYEKVRRRERDTVVADQRGQWARHPPSTKISLSHGNNRDKGRSWHANDNMPRHQKAPTVPQARAPRDPSPPAQRKRTAGEQAAVAEKKRKLLSKYG